MSLPAPNVALEQSLDFFTKDSDVCMMLMDVEEALRSSGKTDVADRLDKFQRDITGYYAFADTATPKAGEQTRTFVDGYEAITPSRLNTILRDVSAALPEGALKRQFGDFMLATLVPETPAVVASAKPTKFKPR